MKMQQNSSNASSTSAQRKRTRKAFPTVFLLFAVAILAISGGGIIAWIVKNISTRDINISDSNETPSQNIDQDIDQPQEQKPEFIDLQPTIDAWLKDTSVQVGLMIYDLDNNKVAAEYNPNQIFNVASIYKLFFTYVGYQQLELGEIDANEYYLTTSDYRAGNYNFGECLDLMIRESYNGCADHMRDDTNMAQNVKELTSELGLENTSELGLYSTAADLTKLLIRYWGHPDLSSQAWEKIADSMLNQPATEIAPGIIYNWRQGLPSGFNATQVYDKVGWEWNGTSWNTYADAAFLVTANRHYSAVVLTSGLTDPETKPLCKLGEQIETAINFTH